MYGLSNYCFKNYTAYELYYPELILKTFNRYQILTSQWIDVILEKYSVQKM